MRILDLISIRTIKQIRVVTKNSFDEFQLPVNAPAKEQNLYIIINEKRSLNNPS